MTDEQIMAKLSQMIRVGFVNARMPEKMRVKVTIPDTVGKPLITDFLPVLCPRACEDMQYDLPDIGDQVLVLFLAYGLEQGFVVGAMYGKQVPPVQSGDKWHRRFKDGAFLEYDREKHELKAEIPGTAIIKCEESITLEAPIIYLRGKLVSTDQHGQPGQACISGGMEITNGGLNVPDADVKSSGVSLVSHTTEGVQAGNDTSRHPTGGSASSPGTGPIGAAAMTASQLALIQNARLGNLRDKVEEHGNDIEEIIMCLPEIADALAEQAEKEGRKKDAIGLRYLAAFFRKWLAGLANEDLSKSEPAEIDFKWILDFPRAEKIFNDWIKLSGEPKTVLSPAGEKELKKYLSTFLKKKLETDPLLKSVPFFMKGQEYFNYVSIPHLEPKEINPDSLEGLFAAMGAFTIRAQAFGIMDKLDETLWQATIKRLCFFAHDQFNFPKEFWKGECQLTNASISFQLPFT